jgi:hypothetical protein
MPVSAIRFGRLARRAVPVLGLLAAACGSASHVPASHPTADQKVAFLRSCSNGVGSVGRLGDAAVCQCALTQLEARTNQNSFGRAVYAWKNNINGAQHRLIVATTINRCAGQQQIDSARQSGATASAANLPPSRTASISKATYTKTFRWPDSSQSMLHSCFTGTAVANGMSCSLAQAIASAFSQYPYPDSSTPVVRYLHLVNPDNGRVVAVSCAISGRKGANPVCNAPQRQVALLPAPGYDD